MSQLTATINKLVDPEFGLINYLTVLPRASDEANIYLGFSQTQNPLSLPPRNDQGLVDQREMKQGAGVGFTLEECLWSTLGESVERYAACIYNPEDIRVESYNAISSNENVLNPNKFIRYAEEQYNQPEFQFMRPDLDAKFGWKLGVNATKGEEVWIPASMAYMYYKPFSESDGKMDSGYSTGLAAGSDYFMAIHSGLCEAIERDSYSLHWFLKKTAPRIPVERVLQATNKNVAELVQTSNIEIDLRDYTTDLGIPCALSQIRTPAINGVASGSSVNMNALKCTEKAIVESFHTLNWCYEMARLKKPDLNLEDIKQYKDHVMYYMSERKERFNNIEFMFDESPLSTMSFVDEEETTETRKTKLKNMFAKLKAKGYDVYVVDLTTDELRDAGFVVVKVLVPGLHPLYCGTGREHLDTRRIQQFASSLGLEGELKLNTHPHPFP